METTVLVLVVFCTLWNRAFFRKHRADLRPAISLSTFLSLAVFASWTLPNGTISGTPLEMYHYGEIAEPLHELLNYGVVPYILSLIHIWYSGECFTP